MIEILGPIYIETLIVMLLLWPIFYLLALPLSKLQKWLNPESTTLKEQTHTLKYLLILPGQLFWVVIVLYLVFYYPFLTPGSADGKSVGLFLAGIFTSPTAADC